MNVKSPIEIDQLNEYSDRLYSVQNKFFTACIISIFISIFELSSDTTVFGFAINNANERIIELGACLIAVMFGLTYLLRLLEEKDIYKKIDKRISEIYSNYNNVVNDFKDSNKHYGEIHSDVQTLKEHFFDPKGVAYDNINSAISKWQNVKVDDAHFESDKIKEQCKIEISLMRRDITDKIQSFPANLNMKIDLFEGSLGRIEKVISNLETVSTNSRTKQSLAQKIRLRVIVINFVIPFILFIGVLVCVMCPKAVLKNLEQTFPKETDKTAVSRNNTIKPVMIDSEPYMIQKCNLRYPSQDLSHRDSKIDIQCILGDAKND